MGQVLGLYSNGEFCLQCSTSMSVEMDKSSAAQLPGTARVLVLVSLVRWEILYMVALLHS